MPKNMKKENSASDRKRRLSNIIRPESMSLEEWQIALRKQAAGEENLIVSENKDTDEPGCYIVKNPQTRNVYKIVYRGEESRWNYCSCMDFKSNRLGTCKHLEAVDLWLKKYGKHPVKTLPAYTSVYLSYRNDRKICIRIGSECHEEFTKLAKEYFTEMGELKPDCIYSFSTFLARAKRISDSFRCYQDVLQYVIDMRDEKRRTKLVEEKASDAGLDNLMNVSLYPYQKEGIRFAVKTGKSIIADEMGLGKTVQAIGCAEFLRKENLVSSALVVCPTSLKYQWKKEIERFTGAEVLVIEGSHLKRKEQYEAEAFYKIISYNSLCNDIKIMGHMFTDLLIMDEAQRLKNWNTQIARAMRRIDSDYRVVLSGTPLENKLQELYSIVQLVNPYVLGPYYQFTDFTTVFSPAGQILGYKNLNVIGGWLKSVMLRRRKADVALQLPSRRDKICFVSMTKEQRVMHDEFHFNVVQIVSKWRKMHFLSENDRKRLLLLLGQMRMVCDSTYILDQKKRYDTKVDEVLQMIEDMCENGDDKMVVFSQWERMTRLVCAELDKRGISYANLHGGVPSVKRKELMDEFTENPKFRVFVSTDAGSTGLNLQVASILVNLDLPWNPAVLEQRIARVYRIGQKKPVQIVNFVSERSIEERMLSTLNFKSNMSEGILDNGTDAVFMEDSKFNRLMETVDEVMLTDAETKEGQEEHVDEEREEVVQPEGRKPLQPSLFPESEWEEQSASEEQDEAASHVSSPKVLLQQGVSFLSGLAETLASQDKTEALLDTIVKEDKETGEMHIEIPVKDKETVKNVFSLFAKIMSSLK